MRESGSVPGAISTGRLWRQRAVTGFVGPISGSAASRDAGVARRTGVGVYAMPSSSGGVWSNAHAAPSSQVTLSCPPDVSGANMSGGARAGRSRHSGILRATFLIAARANLQALDLQRRPTKAVYIAEYLEQAGAPGGRLRNPLPGTLQRCVGARNHGAWWRARGPGDSGLSSDKLQEPHREERLERPGDRPRPGGAQRRGRPS
jgi:hypothetical protein